MSEEHTQPPVGEGAAFIAKLSAATVLGGVAFGYAYRWLELVLSARADAVQWAIGLVSVVVLVACIAGIVRTLSGQPGPKTNG